MKYWLFDGRDAQGPYSEDELRKQPGFSPESLICPDGAASADQWKPARQLLAAKPVAEAPPPMRAEDSRPMARPRPEARPETRPAEVRPPGDLKPQPAAAAPAADGKPGVAGESPEAIRLRLAQALPARRTDPVPEPLPPEPEPVADRTALLRKAGLAAGALALLAGGVLGGRAVFKKRAPTPVSIQAQTPVNAPDAAPEAMGGLGAASGGGLDDVLAYARNFPLQSKPRPRPTDPADVLAPKTWRPAQTLGQLYDQIALESLAQDALASVERQGKSAADGDREIRRSSQLWSRRAARFLERNAPNWSAELTGSRWTVTVRLPSRPSEPARRFETDPAARTLKPVDLISWHDLDPKEASAWGGKYLRLSEDPQQPEGSGPQTPVYQGPGAPKSSAAKTAPPPQPAPERKPAAAKGESGLTDDEEYVDPLESADPKKLEPPKARPAAPPMSKPARRAESKPAARPSPQEGPIGGGEDGPGPGEPVIDTIFTDGDRPRQSAEPIAAPAKGRPALPGSDGRALPPPAPRAAPSDPDAPAGDDAKRKSVSDMSVDELQKYLSRDKKQ